MEGSKSRTRVYERPLAGMGRRRFLKTLGVAGVSAASASQLSTNAFDVASGESVSIVYAYARDDSGDRGSLTPRVKTVSTSWYNDIQSALSSYEAIDLTAIEGVFNASFVPGDGDDPTRVSVDVTDEDVISTVSELLEDTPVEGSVIEASGNSERGDLDPVRQFDLESGIEVPGGIACGDTEGIATLAPAVYDPETESRYFATANHLYADSDRTELTLVVDAQRIQIGEVDRHHRKEDLALVAPIDEFVPVHALDCVGPHRVAGQFTRLGLADLKARGVKIHKIGAMSGHTTGRIQAIDGVTCIYGDPCKRGQIKWGSESDFTDGDSGSVSFAPDPENPDEQVLVCGLNNARTWWPGEDYIWGTGAYVFHEEYGYTF